MTAEKKAIELKKKFGTLAVGAVVDEIIIIESEFIKYINKKYGKDFIYDSIYWQQVKENILNDKA